MKLATKNITESYEALTEDCYIGINCEKPMTLTLPSSPENGTLIIVKAEMKPPIANRRITINTKDDSTIDGYSNYVIQVSNEFVQLIYHGNGWHVI